MNKVPPIIYLCDCPDYTQEERADPTSTSPSRWKYRQWTASRAGISTLLNRAKEKGYGSGDEICYHCWAVKLSTDEFFTVPTT